MQISTGHLVMMDATVKMDIQTVKGAKNIFFGGEGLFNTVVEGPGRIVLQSMPVANLAGALSRYLPTGGEGSADNAGNLVGGIIGGLTK